MKTTLTLKLFSITFKPSNDIIWAVSSVGRASVLQTGGRRFESCTAHQSSLIRAFRLGKLRLAAPSEVRFQVKHQQIYVLKELLKFCVPR